MTAAIGLLILVSPFVLGFAIFKLRRRRKRIAEPAAPPPGPALDAEATKVAFWLYALRGLAIVPGGILWTVATFWLSPWVGSAGLIVSFGGVFCVGNAVIVWWRLRRSAWRAHPCRIQAMPGMAGGTRVILVLDPDGSEADGTLELSGFIWRCQQFAGCDGATIWTAGEPARGCVVALPGGTHFAWARRPWGRRNRERLRRVVLKQPLGEVDLSPYAVELDRPG
ncbi:MAG TPA: hypothetical protein VD741_09620 [Solirubrobacterales bacterium]|nr:hypothetical protein [Solirubrobacterales bacterium]